MRTGYSEKLNEQIEGIRKQKIDYMGNDISSTTKQALERELELKEGCRIVGTAKLHKVPSTIFVSTEAYQWAINKLV